ncbi:uncharacterized protein LOC125033918 [Penaeus chinensis]|uniref:uncharacterized protein LOC125033918 n=1 Tax=Penaeus chinensis TaxID=139456 RepID=UPI001FB57CF5|nr:uncharacterized protein LOC125033918 [Penaeus chinensis]
MEEAALGRLKRLAMWRCLQVWAVLGVLGAALGEEGGGGVVVAPPEEVSEGEAGVAQPLMGTVVVPSFPSTFPFMEFTDYGVLGHLAPSARPSRPSGSPSHALESRHGRLPNHNNRHRHDDAADPILQGSVPVNAYHNPTTGVKGSRWAPSASSDTASWGSSWGGRSGSAGPFENTLDGGGDGEGTLKAALNTLWSHRWATKLEASKTANDVYTSLEDTDAVSKTWLDMLENHGHGSSASVNHRDDGPRHAYQPGTGSSKDHQSGFGFGQTYQPALKSGERYRPSLSSSQAYQPRPKPNQAFQPSLRPSQGYQPQPGMRTKQTFQASGSFAGEPLHPQKSFGSLKNPSQRPTVPAGGRRPILLGPSPNGGWQVGSTQNPLRQQGTQRMDVGKVPQGAIKGLGTPWRRTSGAAVSDRRRLHVGNATPLQMVRIRHPISQAGLSLQQGMKNDRTLSTAYLPNGRPSGVGFTKPGTHGVRVQPPLTPSRLGLASTSLQGGTNWMRQDAVGGAGSTGSIGPTDRTMMLETESGLSASTGEPHVTAGHKGLRNGQTALTEEQIILMSDLMTGQSDMMSGQGNYMTGQTVMTGQGGMTYTGLKNAANTGEFLISSSSCGIILHANG